MSVVEGREIREGVETASPRGARTMRDSRCWTVCEDEERTESQLIPESNHLPSN